VVFGQVYAIRASSAHGSKNIGERLAHGGIVINDENHRLRFGASNINYYRVRRSRLPNSIQTLSTAPDCRLLRIAELQLLLLDISVNESRALTSSDLSTLRPLTPSARLLRNLITIPARADERLKLFRLIARVRHA